jgi:hypothetical protein
MRHGLSSLLLAWEMEYTIIDGSRLGCSQSIDEQLYVRIDNKYGMKQCRLATKPTTKGGHTARLR